MRRMVNSVEGLTIVRSRLMTRAELLAEGWEDENAVVLELSDGSLLYPSRDDEGNAPGVFFWLADNKQHNYILKG
jgi:hypothetical protein